MLIRNRKCQQQNEENEISVSTLSFKKDKCSFFDTLRIESRSKITIFGVIFQVIIIFQTFKKNATAEWNITIEIILEKEELKSKFSTSYAK